MRMISGVQYSIKDIEEAFCGSSRTRTYDLSVKSRLLYRLSYEPFLLVIYVLLTIGVEPIPHKLGTEFESIVSTNSTR